MKERAGRILFCFLLLLAGIVWCPRSSAAPWVVQPGEENVTLINDRSLTWPISSALSPRLVAGDFNGDGHEDLAIEMVLPSPERVGVDLFLGPFGKEAFFSSRSDMQVDFSRDASHVDLPRLLMADINKDGKDDLILGRAMASSSRGQIDILFGRSIPEENVPLDAKAPDLRILGKPGTDRKSVV